MGFGMLSLGIGALQMMLDRGEQLDWFSSAEIMTETTVSIVAFYMFFVHSFTAKDPFVPLRLFRDRNFATGIGFIFVVGIILLATLALLTPFLQLLMGYPVVTAGLVLAPRGVGTMLAMMAVGRMIARVDTRHLILGGLILTAIALWQMTHFTQDVSQAALIESGFIQGAGLGFIFVPLSTNTFGTLAPADRAQGTGLFSLMRNLGSSIGISVVSSLLTSETQINHANLTSLITPYNRLLQAPPYAQIWNPSSMAGRAVLDAEITRQATLIGYLDAFKLMLIVCILAMPLVLLLRKPRSAPDAHAAAAALD
jgi:DHA2 family multidrug resistance protein